MSNRKILITGSCGFLLGNYVRKLVYDKKPYEVSSVDRVNANALNSMYWNRNHPFYPADITDVHIMNIIFQREQPDIVIHGAAETSTKDTNSLITSNVLGTQVIIDACLKHKVSKLIYISTDGVYGQLASENEEPWKEEKPLNPTSPYSISKASGELLVKAAHATHGLTYNITRSSNNYGQRQLPEKLIPKAIKCILEKQRMTVYGEGKQIRDWTYVADTCAAITTVLEKGLPNETYNISARQEFTNIEVIQEVCNAMGSGHDLIQFVKEGSKRDFRRAVNTDKLQGLGWKPSYKFKDGVIETKNWFQMNQWFLK